MVKGEDEIRIWVIMGGRYIYRCQVVGSERGKGKLGSGSG
jgi:hypothetical protein